ncbi:hypothetical protein [Methylobrevis pamukkalensis]|uniref:Uncharacterized protein n=1 Tax=Methylobrevis pamukkalensis TaxID=1439726 RepID=A0A1E3H1E4_9HYPH|nr:hypothetical protein [Methylobrevis pamukkalensis]ODN70127.1 hypothetical protein A6302_02549 [Methylobrevis pamukkalensis]
MQILPGSQLIGAGNANLLPADIHDIDGDGDTGEALPQDANGNPRDFGGGLDIGASELAGMIVTTLDDESADADFDLAADIADGGGLSLREAIFWAGETNGREIGFAEDLSGGTIALTLGELQINQSLLIDGDIDGDDKADITISGDADGDGDGNSGVIYVSAGTEVTLSSLSLTKGLAANGGGIRTGTGVELTLRHTSLFDNVATGRGGGLFLGDFSALYAVNTTISGNVAGYAGGVFVDNSSSATFFNATIHGNHGYFAGGIETDSASHSCCRTAP